MEHFVIQRKVEHYRAMIKNATDLERRGCSRDCFSTQKLSSSNTTKIAKRNNRISGPRFELNPIHGIGQIKAALSETESKPVARPSTRQKKAG
jgi:hypothetical protein